MTARCWRVARNVFWDGGFVVEQLLPLEIFNTPKNVLPSYILFYYMSELSEGNGKRELGSRPCLLKQFVNPLYFFHRIFLITKKQVYIMTSHFSPYSSYFIELKSILGAPTSKYFIQFQKAGSNLSFSGFSLKV